MRRRVAVIAVALTVDAAFGEPADRCHPVAWLGRFVSAFEKRVAGRRHRLFAGLGLLTGTAGLAAAVGVILHAITGRLPGRLAILGEGVALKPSFAARSLFAHAEAVRVPLAAGEIVAARGASSRMVGRETETLPAGLVASAAIESVAENLSDSVVAPLTFYLLAGLPGAYGYRAVNTLDAVVGYRSRGRFGMPSARADDMLNLVPARMTAALVVLANAGRRRALAGTWRDRGATPSPNSGWPMAAMAHALDVRLEKRGHHVLNGAGREPGPGDIRRGVLFARRALAVGLTALVLVSVAEGGEWWRT